MASMVHRAIDKVQRAMGVGTRFPGEIKSDDSAQWIERLAAQENVSTILEIGSSAGGGSTGAFVTGIRSNPNRPTLFCMEVSKERFAELTRRYESDAFVKCYNTSSVPLEKFVTETEVREFYGVMRPILNSREVDVVLGWLRSEIAYLKASNVPTNGIEIIKRENSIDHFDMVLIDGSEFTGRAELDAIDGARLVLLDDINALKNHYNCMRLIMDRRYTLVASNTRLRNGYAIFKRIDVPPS